MNEIRQALLEDPTIYNFDVSSLGPCTVPSPLNIKNFVDDNERASFHTSLGHITDLIAQGKTPASFEKGGPRKKLFHDPKWTRAAIVTCGGLCPGINDVIKGIVSVLHHGYKVTNIFGIRYGFRGLIPSYGYSPMELTPDVVDNIHTQGGTILGSSRGEQNIDEMCDTLQRLNINVLFCVGGDGTLSGASRIARTLKDRKQAISVIGVPKTIDNDLCFIDRTFGFETAVLTTTPIITCAHNEAKGAERGIGLVKLMGRDSGFVAAAASLANSYVNFCLVPEEKFTLHGKGSLIEAIEKRFAKGKDHAVIVVAEGAGQELFDGATLGSDKSGNKRKHDIGTFLMEEIEAHFAAKGNPAEEVTIKYFNPSYLIRSVPSEGTDAIFCFTLAKYAVHAAMAGKTDMVVGYWGNKYTHIPIELATMKRKRIDLDGVLWRSVVGATRQDQYFEGE